MRSASSNAQVRLLQTARNYSTPKVQAEEPWSKATVQVVDAIPANESDSQSLQHFKPSMAFCCGPVALSTVLLSPELAKVSRQMRPSFRFLQHRNFVQCQPSPISW